MRGDSLCDACAVDLLGRRLAGALSPAVSGFIGAVADALKKGDRVTLVGFGSFEVSTRKARTGRNPRTGEEVRGNIVSVKPFGGVPPPSTSLAAARKAEMVQPANGPTAITMSPMATMSPQP